MHKLLIPLTIGVVACSGDDDTKEESSVPDTGGAEDSPTADTSPDDTSADTGTPPQIAPTDNDTLDNPLFTESFVGSGVPRTFTVADAISAAPGDPEDWVEFTTPALKNEDVNITFDLTCTGTETIAIQLWDVDTPPPTDLGPSSRINCASSPDSRLLETNNDYAVRVFYPSAAEAGDYTDWSLTVSW